MLGEHGGARAIKFVYVKGRGIGGVHGDTPNQTDLSKRQDVGNGVGVVPHGTEIFDGAHLGGHLVSAAIGLQV